MRDLERGETVAIKTVWWIFALASVGVVSCTGGGSGGGGNSGGGSGGVAGKVVNCEESSETALGTWSAVGGPLGGLGYNIRSPEGSPETIYVTDAWSGLQKSTDRGRTWAKANGSGVTGITARDGASLDAIPVFSFKIDPNDSSRLWAGTQNGHGLFKSTDAGQTWTKADTGIALNFDVNLAGLTIRHIEVVPGDSQTVYVMGEKTTGVTGIEFHKVSGFIYRSVDGGANFTLLKEFDSLTRWMFVNPSNTQEMIVFTGIFDREADTANSVGVGAFRSIDGGGVWTAANSGLSTGKSLYIGGVARHPTQASTLVIATGNNADAIRGTPVYGGVYKTTDFGATWTDISPTYNSGASTYQDTFTAVAFAKSDPQTIYVGSEQAIYRSADGGTTWNRFGGENGGPWGPKGIRAGFPIDLIADEEDANTLYVNNYGGGVFKSVDGGRTWESWSQGYSGADIRGLAVNAKGCVWANGRSGAFLSQNGAQTWEGLKAGTASFIAEGGAILADRADAKDLTFLKADAFEGKIYRTTDGGVTWTAAGGLPSASGEPGDRHGAVKIVQAASDSARMYAIYMRAGYRYSNVHDLTLGSSHGVYRSDDGGANWIQVNQGLPNGGNAAGDLNVSDISVSGTDKNLVYISLFKGGVYKSADGGSTWTSALGALPAGEAWTDVFDPTGAPIPRSSILSVAISPASHSEVMIGTNVHGLYKSVDGGVSWAKVLSEATMITGSDKDHAHLMAVVYDSTDATRIFAADWHSGVFKSTNAGATWTRVNSGLTTRAVNTLSLSESGKWIFAGTQGEGVFRMRNF